MTKKILGLDLGTNSIGWALLDQDFQNKKGKILGAGTRIIPMSQDIIGEFGKGNSVSQTAERTRLRSVRRLRERHLLRRQRLHRVLNILGFLPEHYAQQIDFSLKLGQYKDNTEPKLVYNEKQFIFKSSFEEMLADFSVHSPSILQNAKGEKALVPYDWTLYYLRKKALTRRIEKEELAWILLNFNQKRGYYQLRGEEEEEENPNKLIEYHSLKIIDIKADEQQKGKSDTWYSLILENGWIYRRSSKTPLFDWVGKTRDFIVTSDLNDDGTVKLDKDGSAKRSFRAPGEDDWILLKKKTEQEIQLSEKTVGTFIYDTLLKNPKQKIKGKLVRTIERKFYKQELKQILEKQKEFHQEFQSEELYYDCIRELYRNNETKQQVLTKKDLAHLFIEDIIFYQRPLRSQKSLISNCSLEFRKYKNADGVEVTHYLKAAPKSNPFYQEFRIWQWMYNLSIYRKEDDVNLTHEFLQQTEDFETLFEFLNDRRELDQKAVLKFLLEKKALKGKELTQAIEKYRWNFVADKKYPGNETRNLILSRLKKVANIPENFLSKEKEYSLWHLIYSISDKIEYEKALRTFAAKNKIDENTFYEAFRKFPPFPSDYGSFSEKAIRKVLPLIRMGKFWSWEAIDPTSKKRIANILTGEFDPKIRTKVREKALHLTEESHFQGLQLWLAQYIVYDRHSEAAIAGKWTHVSDLENYIKEFRQHSLRNPIVEQVITETLRVVKDIWVKYGNGKADFFDEIHIELGREMKNTAEERGRLTRVVTENENTNIRIKLLLADMLAHGDAENVRPFSPAQQDILKIYEEAVLNSDIEIEEEILKISKTAQPTTSELRRYRLWLEQKYRSPYTGQIIPLNKLFTPQYEIEHIIPQSRYFDDSLSNKVICESAVNKLKDNQLGLEFIKNHHGEKVETGFGGTAQVMSEKEYEDFVKQNYSKNRTKRNKLLLDEIPEKFIERQLNDTRYISKFISATLSNIVRSNENDDGINSKNLIPGNGKVTTELKKDWGLNDVWNDLILPRFERMNTILKTNTFTTWNENHQKFLPTVPLEFAKGFSKKRIDHRHHALDAIVIAAANRDHINLLNNISAQSKERYDLNRKLKTFEKVRYQDARTKEMIERDVPKAFIKPWPDFTSEVRHSLETIIVSFKQNLRVINKTTNYYEKWVEKDGLTIKEQVKQVKGDSWAVRKPMHKDTVSGLIKLRKQKNLSLSAALDDTANIVWKELRREITLLQTQGYDKKKVLKHFKDRNNIWQEKDVSRVAVWFWEEDNVASRVALNDTFSAEKIESITDTAIQLILKNHLNNYKNKLDAKGKEIPAELLAFSPEGIEEMNKNILALNNGKPHQPILKVRTYEPKGNKFQVGVNGNKGRKYVEAAKGTNLYFAIYRNSTGIRSYSTLPFNEVLENQKQNAILNEKSDSVTINNLNGDELLFLLSPNDLVFLPNEEERMQQRIVNFENPDKDKINRIYKTVSFTGNRGYFIHQTVATAIVDKSEYSLLNKIEKSAENLNIKELAWKIKVDRLGHVTHFKK